MRQINKYIPLIFALFWMFSFQNSWGQCELTISTSGENTDFVQMLVLAETDGTIIDVVSGNNATFMTPATGSYNVHALNYDPLNPPDPLPVIGGTIVGVGSVSGCFNSNNFGTDIKPIECLCEAETITASFSAQPNFAIIYALADATGLILATNTTGTFTVADGLADDTFIHALHYDTANPPSPLPTVGINVSDVGTSTLGCFNNEFVSNPLCILVSPAPAPTEVELIRVCTGNAMFVSEDGVNPIDATGLTFTWYLDGVEVAVIEGLPYYSPTQTGNYTVAVSGNATCDNYLVDSPFVISEIIDCQDCD